MERRDFLKGLAMLAAAPALIELPVEAAVPQPLLIADAAASPVIDTFRRTILKGSEIWKKGAILLSGDKNQWLVVNETPTHVELEMFQFVNMKRQVPELAENTEMAYLCSAFVGC